MKKLLSLLIVAVVLSACSGAIANNSDFSCQLPTECAHPSEVGGN